MRDEIRNRTIKLAQLIIKQQCTVRELAKQTGYSKSTVHKDLTSRLPNINPTLFEQVAHILAYHKSIRHLLGGEATKQKWAK